MQLRLLFGALGAFYVVLLAGCRPGLPPTPPAGVAVTDAFGVEVQFPVVPQRIVSLDPTASGLVVALGAGGQLVGVAEGEQPLDSLYAVPQVALQGPQALAALQALAPELVLVSGETFSTGIRGLGRSVGATVVFVPADSLHAAAEGLRLLGTLLGRPRWGEHLADSLVAATEQALAPFAGRPGPSVLVVVGEETFRTASGQTYLGACLRHLGARNLFETDSLRYPVLTRARVQTLAPEVILLISSRRDYAGRFLEAFPELTQSPAVKQQRFHQARPDLVQRPGLRTPEALELLGTLCYSPAQGTAPTQP